jgi:hypothetical protein
MNKKQSKTTTMKNNFTLQGLFVLLFLGINLINFGQDTAKVSAYFIGSHGYLLESSHAKVALDALIYWEGTNYGYIKPPSAVASQMESAVSPFDSLDLILIGHAHEDHYNTEIVERAMLKNEHAVLVTTPDVRNDIESNVDSFSFYSDRIWVPDLEFYHSADTVINDIPLTITSIPHGSSGMELYVPAFELDSIRFVQLNGWNSLTAVAYDTLGFNDKRADVIFLCYSYLLDNAKNQLFREHLHPLFSTISHVDGATSGRLNQIQDSIFSKRDEYPMNMLYIPMEQLQYQKVNDTILVDTLNNAPIQIAEVPAQELIVNELFSLTLPEDIFNDIEGDPVNVTVTSSTGGALPEWLSYNPSSRILEGTPTADGNLTIMINGGDTHFAIRSFTVRMVISSPEGVQTDENSSLQLFPNPADEKITLYFEGTIHRYEIMDILGKVIRQGYIEPKGTIDISDFMNGIYYIRLNAGNQMLNSTFFVD